jgi:hypothetical protein
MPQLGIGFKTSEKSLKGPAGRSEASPILGEVHAAVSHWIRLGIAAFALLLVLAPPASPAASLPSGPTVTSPPVVIGTASAGKRLTGLSGVWAGSGSIVYRFQWFRCNAAGADCFVITGATSPTYTLVSRDVGKTLGLKVQATDSTGTASAYASLVGPVAVARPPLESTVQPSIEGTPIIGKTLKVNPGVWSPLVTTFSYTWDRCNAEGRTCAPIPGADKPTYKVHAADLGQTLVALVQAENGGTTQNAFSTATPAAVAPSVTGPVLLSPPAVGGAAAVGNELVVSTGRWQSVGPLSLSFRWYSCDPLGRRCAMLLDATGATQTLTGSEIGKTIGVTLHGRDMVGETITYSSLIGPVAPAGGLVATGAPLLSGAAQVGSSLSVNTGSWSVAPSGYSYRWLRCDPYGRRCTTIAGATSASYALVPADAGYTLIAEVNATSGEASQVSLSNTSALVG